MSQEEAGRRLAAVVSDDRYMKSGSYYSWEGEARCYRQPFNRLPGSPPLQ